VTAPVRDALLTNLFSGLSDELARWAVTGENLQHLAGQLLAERPDSREALIEVQQLDALVQHIEQMAALCGRLSAAAADNDGRLDVALVQKALSDVTLAGLTERFGEAGSVAPAASQGDYELW